MSRSIVLVDGEVERSLAQRLGEVLGRRIVTEPSSHPDEVIVLPAQRLEELDLDLACAVAPPGDLQVILDWAMDRGDVLTRWEHEQVMP